DLCTGIGGFHIAAEWAGFETIGFSEIDPYCCKLLGEKWPGIKNYGDLRTADFGDVRGCTVLSAGVPCQPASIAGKRRGANDDRWLWPAVLDAVGRVEPAWCIFENPPGIATLHEFNGVLLRLAGMGYKIRLFSVPANAVGAKHRRERVFIVANRTNPLADAEKRGIRRGLSQRETGQFARGGETLADAEGPQGEWQRSGGFQPEPAQLCGTIGDFRLTESPLCRTIDGISNRSHRLKALGNACVPAQCLPFFQAIYQVETCLQAQEQS